MYIYLLLLSLSPDLMSLYSLNTSVYTCHKLGHSAIIVTIYLAANKKINIDRTPPLNPQTLIIFCQLSQQCFLPLFGPVSYPGNCITFSGHASLDSFNLEHFSVSLSLSSLWVLKNGFLLFYGTTLNTGLSDVSSWPDTSHAFVAGISQKWCCAFPGASCQEAPHNVDLFCCLILGTYLC